MNTLDWALELLSFGYCCVPEIDKKPLIKWSQIGLRSRRPTEDEVREWFKDGASIGILTGKFHGLVVVDADSEEACKYVELTTGGSPVQIVTSRGKHYWFRHPGYAVKCGRRLDEPPTDVKGEGGKSTGPGSVHKSGHIYHLAPECDLVSVKSLPLYNPNWFPEAAPTIPDRPKIVGTQAPMNVLERSARYLAKVPGAGKGSRNEHAFRVACSAVRDFGVDYDAGVAMLSQWDCEANDPPLGTREIQTIVASALNGNRKQPIGWKAG